MGMRRKPHRKSRAGCNECKRRRIKCDEEKPQCTNCVRHETSCIYAQPPSTLRSSCNLSPTAYLSPPSQASQGILQKDISDVASHISIDLHAKPPSPACFELKDLALFHHWIMVTSRSILRTPQLDHYWQTVFPEVAFQHPYVMHSMLSITALHVAYLRPLERHVHLSDATAYHLQALGGFRESIGSISPHNSDALFASATLTFFYAFVTFGTLANEYYQDDNPMVHTSRILGCDWIPLVRGIEAVLHPVYDNVRSGPLRNLLGLGNWDELDPNTQPGAGDKNMLQLQEIWTADNDAEIYDNTLHMLRKTSAWMMQFQTVQGSQVHGSEYNRDWSGPFMWLFLVPEKYFMLLQQRQPPALIIFAHFGALLQYLDEYWWMDGCGKSVVSVVDGCLGPYWIPWMNWPKHVVGLG